MGCQDRQRLPLRGRGLGVHARTAKPTRCSARQIADGDSRRRLIEGDPPR